MCSVVTSGPDDTRKLGRILADFFQAGDCIPLIGDMGSGKTCFVQGVAEGLHVPPDLPVSSPSFTLANRYPGRLPLYHVDLFRLEHEDQLLDIELDELIHGDGVTLIEWPQIAASMLVHPIMRIEFVWDMTCEEERRITFFTEEPRFYPFCDGLTSDRSRY